MQSAVKKAVATLLAAALILTAPGLPFYQALAEGPVDGTPVTVGTGNGGATPTITPGLPGDAKTDGSSVSGNRLGSHAPNANFGRKAFGVTETPAATPATPLSPFTGRGRGPTGEEKSVAAGAAVPDEKPAFIGIVGEALRSAPSRNGVVTPSS